MEKILNTKGLGVSGRQNELIELALTFKFNSVEVDMNDLIGRHDTMGKEFACQFLKSAKINIGSFLLPIDLESSDEEFAAASEKLDTIFSLCETLGGKRCRIAIATSSDEAFQQNFERNRTRLLELGEKFAANNMKLGLMLQSPGNNEKDNKFIQTPEEIMTLVKTVGHESVGVCLDTWQWRASGGGMDQINDIEASKVTEIAMADVSETTDPASLSESDRTIPGRAAKSFSLDVFNHLKNAGYDGAVSIATHLSTFSNVHRDKIVHRISQTLDRMIAGEALDEPVAEFRDSEAEKEPAEDAASEDKAEGATEGVTEGATEEKSKEAKPAAAVAE